MENKSHALVAGIFVLVVTALLGGLAIWLMRGFYVGIPRELEDAAQIDGASAFQAFRQVTLPLAIPGIMATAGVMVSVASKGASPSVTLAGIVMARFLIGTPRIRMSSMFQPE